jgi:hypothetical protein
MKRIPECDRCLLNAHSTFLVCAVHPSGPDEEFCIDFQEDPKGEPEELWEPIGASYYNGELILQTRQQRTLEEQLDILNWHPIFTGRCPNCEMPISETEPHRVYWDCDRCGWKDDSI